ncbi:sulfatase-like hydrolase/transferase [Compostibacter hankyongensis]|uniref:Sulfatase-like hydrolase/transferase n=1 Tax=Compostibacter hankyongensis TaxID=1007089 RepID=A0ABP8FN53_9BACT
MKRISCIPAIILFFLLSAFICRGQQVSRPNIIFIYIDDMGYADLSCYGNTEMQTPNIDRLAKEGIKFTDFYVSSPVCSPSRAGAITGQYPGRNKLYGYIDSRWKNQQREMADWLDPDAPVIARTMKKAGYATAHIGKWHLGGGRDIGNAPLPGEYGYDKTLVAFEGLGNRVLIRGNDGLNAASAKLGNGHITWVDHDWQKTPLFVDTTIAFIREHAQEPFYVELWFNDVHDPFEPRPDLMKKFKKFANDKFKQQYFATLYEVDEQVGRLLDMLDKTGLAKNTIVVLASDNGPTDWPRYYRDDYYPPGSAGYFRGRKWSLYEGGIREPLLVRWPGHIGPGKVDSTTITCNIDLFPTLCRLADVPVPGDRLDGEDMSRAWAGRPQQRKEDLMWVYGFNDSFLKPANPRYRSPELAIREGQWKLLVNGNGTHLELYDLKNDIAESENVSAQHPDIAKRLSEKVIGWWKSMRSKP